MAEFMTEPAPKRRGHAGRRQWSKLALGFVATLASFLLSWTAVAAPESHLLRIDPRTSQTEGSPILTTVIEVVQNKSMGEILGPCAQVTGDAELDCIADTMEKPQALWDAIDFPEANAALTVMIDGAENPLTYQSKARWGASLKEEGVGTAWLIMIDAAATMGNRFDEAKTVAQSFVNLMGPNDIVDVMFFNDRGVVQNSHWLMDQKAALAAIDSVKGTFTGQGRTRGLFGILKSAVTDGFKELGNTDSKVKVPMHQALVILSNGASGGDPGSTGPVAIQLKQFLNSGRFPEDNALMPKAPVPVISIWFPSKQMDEFVNQARQFMYELANPEIGGLFTVVRDGQASRGPKIASAVRARFDKMWIVRWQASCLATSTTQTFRLWFRNTKPVIAADASFKDVPLGMDPGLWPLDIDVEKTVEAAEKSPIYPGGKLKVFGNFCWGGKKERAELYMVPKNQPVPETLSGGSLEDAKAAQKQLIEAGMQGKVISASDTAVEFEVPEKTKFLAGKDKNMTARLVLYDNVAKRTSAVTEGKIITLKAMEAPPNYLLIGGIAFGGVVLLLLLVSVFRSGGKKRGGGSAAAPPPRPVVSGGAPPPMQMQMHSPQVPGPAFVSRATLSGAQGIFTVLPGMEMHAGRDGASCQILLAEPRVSGQHASLKIESGQLFVRDDNSNNGTMINGNRLPPSVWSAVPQSSSLRFGPVEFSVNLE